MIIKKGKFYENRTQKYIIPSLKMYGPDFAKYYSSMFKLAVGITDYSYPTTEPALFILVDSTVDKDKFINAIKWFKNQSYYIADYPFDSMHNGYQHMIVISIPKKIHSNFINSNYSKMYTEDELKTYKFRSDVLKVLKRDKSRIAVFIKELNNTWNTDFSTDTWKGELDYPWSAEEECFNY